MESDVEKLLAATRSDDPAVAVDALALLRTVRDRLDATERALIESARAGGTSWSRIATALGLRTRQAAEQRFLRLTDTGGTRAVTPTRAARHRQQSVDNLHGPAITALRAATRALLRRVEADDAWPTRFTRAALARHTIALAAEAPPGALFSLATSALDDLPATGLPPTIAEAADRVRAELSHQNSTKD
ncbi:hypothetical protein [Asanoa siamensis]|uniref:Uncharacterized protein n=1 Tax=Asanoa siamensis TaxID=926357 RepID=A0ABQ4CKB8_9ACTN|nr:hypothetical protein [Asanoa siamensis]GIF71734.1 hypothetical protein Asi02nite_12520 [Asanoa siamensis]